MHRPIHRFVAALSGLLIMLTAGPAGAHVEPTATQVPAGSYATVDFAVQHGCEQSPTVKLEFQIPEELDDVVPVDKGGWNAAVDGDVVVFEGGPLPADQEDSFSVAFTVPDTQGVTLTFPFIQTCEQGSIEWIQTTSDAERPAPLVLVGAPDPNAPTGPAPTTTAADTTTTAETATTTATSDASTPTASEETASEETASEETGTNPWLAIIGVIVITGAVIGGVVLLRKRTN